MNNYSAFVASISKLLLGSSMAQAITIIATIASARFYSPENFADFGIYIAVIAILLTFFTGRLDLALIQVSSTLDYKKILSTTFVLLLISSILFIIFTTQLYNFNFGNRMAILIFFGLIANGTFQVYSNLFSSQERYGELGLFRTLAALIFAVLSISFAYFNINVAEGLILASLISQASSAFIFILRSGVPLAIPGAREFKSVMAEYRDYWTMDTLSSLLNTIGRQLPLIIFPAIFGSVIAGYYFFSQRIIAAPINLIANSVGNVFRKGATKEYNEKGNFRGIFLFSFFRLLLLATIGTIIVFVFVDDKIVNLIFGDQWIGITNILKMLIVFYAFKFVVSPLTYSLYVVRKLHWNLYGQFFYLSCLFLPITIGWYLDYDANLVIALHVLGACIAYTCYLGLSYYCAKKGSAL